MELLEESGRSLLLFLRKMSDPGSSFRFCVENGPNLQSITSLIPGKPGGPTNEGRIPSSTYAGFFLTAGMLHRKQ